MLNERGAYFYQKVKLLRVVTHIDLHKVEASVVFVSLSNLKYLDFVESSKNIIQTCNKQKNSKNRILNLKLEKCLPQNSKSHETGMMCEVQRSESFLSFK